MTNGAYSGNAQQTVQAAPYNTRSAQVPLPDARNHPIPGVRDLSLTDRFARVKRKFATKDKTFRLDAALKDETKFFETRVNHLEIFLKANTQRCPGVVLDTLRERSMTDRVKQKAQTTYDKMRADRVQPRSMSGIWTEDVEKDPEWLVIYASEHMDDKGNIQRDGFNAEEMAYMMEQTQDHLAVLGVETPQPGGDTRHLANVDYPFMDYIDASGEKPRYKIESIGTRHDVHCWHKQAHKTSNPLPSTDLRGKATAEGAVTARSYIFATALQSKYLDMLVKRFAPKEYEELKASAKAGRWYTEHTEGCTLGLTTTWKVQVGLHLDKGDWELCIITCGGNFLGGKLYLPDLNLCLAYKPGDVVIFRSPYLFHAIGPWMPGRMGPNDTCTPGRVSWVHFTHADVHEKLQGKKEGYFLSGGFTGVGVTKADHYE